jgi:hypothetical protein
LCHRNILAEFRAPVPRVRAAGPARITRFAAGA